ncbi:MAG: hypothetical protein DWP97_08365 [Calditrichaeota bacterium]|nr:MAG: hypothetical protein DWP97_08365 [Calditrichota bacterium]
MGTGVMRGNMPPFLGTEEEAQMIAAHLVPKLDSRHIADIYGLEGIALGKKVYDIRCGKCHVIGGFNDKSESITGLEETDYIDMLDYAGDYAEEMPDFTGDEKEREALIKYLLSLSNEGGTE